MKIACIGDIHLISSHDPQRELLELRSFFIPGQKSLLKLFDILLQHNIDLVIFLGDLVDWASEENINFAMDFLSMLKIPWKSVPGNHDFSVPCGDADKPYSFVKDREHRHMWQDKGLLMENEWIDAGDFGISLIDNAFSNFEPDSLDWLDKQLNKKPYNLVCQHVPLDLPDIRQCIHAVAPNRPLDHYTCSAHPQLFDTHYKNRVQAVASGHVHMSGRVTIDNCTHYLCNVGIELKDNGRNELADCSATLLTFHDGQFSAEIVYAR